MNELLLVEDDIYVTETLTTGVEIYNIASNVLAVRSGTAATSMMQSRHFDLVVTDVRLPDMSGFKVAREAANFDFPALLMTGHPQSHEVCEALDFPYLYKPFLLRTLAERAILIGRRVEENIIQIRRSYDRYLALERQSRELYRDSQALIRNSQKLCEETQRLQQSSLTRSTSSATTTIPNRGAGRKPSALIQLTRWVDWAGNTNPATGSAGKAWLNGLEPV